jgi:hypothetical protein
MWSLLSVNLALGMNYFGGGVDGPSDVASKNGSAF